MPSSEPTSTPACPGEDGGSVAGEQYRVSEAVGRRVEAGEPEGLYCGVVGWRTAALCRASCTRANAAEGHRDISAFGGWRDYLASRSDLS